MTRVLLAPTAVLAHLDPVGIVALGLLCLVVATLALVTGECHSDTHVSAGHGSSVVSACGAPGERKTPPGSARSRASVAPLSRARSRRCRATRSASRSRSRRPAG